MILTTVKQSVKDQLFDQQRMPNKKEQSAGGRLLLIESDHYPFKT